MSPMSKWQGKKPLKISVRVPPGKNYGWDESDSSLENTNELYILQAGRRLLKRESLRKSLISKHGSKSDPMYHILYHPKRTKGKPFPKPASASEKSKRIESVSRRFVEAQHKRALIGRSLPPGAGSWLRRVVPKNFKPGGELPTPESARKAGFKPGGYMERSEAGGIGEALLFLNPRLRATLSDHYGGELTPPEILNIEAGRRANSPFDMYAGTWGIELKTVSLATGRQSTKVTANRPIDDLELSREGFAKKHGLKMAVVTMVVDQEKMAVHLLAWDVGDPSNIDGKSLNIQKATPLTPAGGVKISEAEFYEAYWVASQQIPTRVNPEGMGYTIEVVGSGKNRRVVPQGTPSTSVTGAAIMGAEYLSRKVPSDIPMRYGE